MCLISVVIPVFNTSRFLGWLLESISKTRGLDLEFIFVDDASGDDSAAILRHFLAENSWLNAQLLVHQRNGGLSLARRSGYQQASGEYVWFLDSDDHFDVESLRKIYEIVLARRFDAIIFEHRECRIEAGVMTYLNVVQRQHAAKHSATDGQGAMIACLRDRNVYAWGLIARKSAFQQNFFPPGKLFEDIPTIPVVLAACHSVKYASYAVVNYLLRSDSIMHNVTLKSCIDLMGAGQRLRLRATRFEGGLDRKTLEEVELYRVLCLLWAARRAYAGGQWEEAKFQRMLRLHLPNLNGKIEFLYHIRIVKLLIKRQRWREAVSYIMLQNPHSYRCLRNYLASI